MKINYSEINRITTSSSTTAEHCEQVYPHLDVWNVVEASEKVTIGNWCNFAHNNCHHRFKVRPFRCLGNTSFDQQQQQRGICDITLFHFGATVCKTVRPMLSVRCLSVCLSVYLSCLSICDAGVLWPNRWMDQDDTWHGGRPRPHSIT